MTTKPLETTSSSVMGSISGNLENLEYIRISTFLLKAIVMRWVVVLQKFAFKWP